MKCEKPTKYTLFIVKLLSTMGVDHLIKASVILMHK